MTKYKNNVRISKENVRKKYNKNILDIYEIFELSGFDNYPKIINYDDREIVYEYIEPKKIYEKIPSRTIQKIP